MRFFMYFYIKSSIGTQGEVGCCKKALNPGGLLFWLF